MGDRITGFGDGVALRRLGGDHAPAVRKKASSRAAKALAPQAAVKAKLHRSIGWAAVGSLMLVKPARAAIVMQDSVQELGRISTVPSLFSRSLPAVAAQREEAVYEALWSCGPYEKIAPTAEMLREGYDWSYPWTLDADNFGWAIDVDFTGLSGEQSKCLLTRMQDDLLVLPSVRSAWLAATFENEPGLVTASPLILLGATLSLVLGVKYFCGRKRQLRHPAAALLQPAQRL